jgi:hypothetical protein
MKERLLAQSISWREKIELKGIMETEPDYSTVHFLRAACAFSKSSLKRGKTISQRKENMNEYKSERVITWTMQRY